MRACECIICDNRPLSLCHEPPNDPFEKAQTQVYADVVMETKVEAISRISNYFSNYLLAELNYCNIYA